jgi:hypothetical protein
MNWQHLIAQNKSAGPFEDDVNNQYTVFHQRGWLSAPAYNRTRTDWDPTQFHLPDAHQLSSMEYVHGSLARGMYAPQLQYWFKYFTLHQDIMVLKYRDFQTDKAGTLRRILEFIGYDGAPSFRLPSKDLEEDYSPFGTSRNIHPPPFTDATRSYLKAFYRPYNDALADLLGEEWRGVWDD